MTGSGYLPVRIGQLWTNSLLERLSTRLTIKTVDFAPTGDRGNTLRPKHYCFDIAIPLAIAAEQEPLGALLFEAKYMGSKVATRALEDHILQELVMVASGKHVVALATLVVACYCYGRRLTGRSLRRTLDIGRRTARAYLGASDALLSRFYVSEENYARLVRRCL